MDGRAVLRFLREAPDLVDRLVFSTGDVASAESARFIESSGCPVLEKPFSIDALRRAVLERAERVPVRS